MIEKGSVKEKKKQIPYVPQRLHVLQTNEIHCTIKRQNISMNKNYL